MGQPAAGGAHTPRWRGRIGGGGRGGGGGGEGSRPPKERERMKKGGKEGHKKKKKAGGPPSGSGEGEVLLSPRVAEEYEDAMNGVSQKHEDCRATSCRIGAGRQAVRPSRCLTVVLQRRYCRDDLATEDFQRYDVGDIRQVEDGML